MSELPYALPQKPWLNLASLVFFDIFWFLKLLNLSFLSILVESHLYLTVKKHKRDWPGGLVINTLSSQCRGRVWSLVRELDTHMPHLSSHVAFHLNSCVTAKPRLSHTSTIIQLSLFIGHLQISLWFWNYLLSIKSSSKKSLHVTTKTQYSRVKYLKNGKKNTGAQTLRAARYKLSFYPQSSVKLTAHLC